MRTFESGETPHESNFTKDGSRIFHASIGKVYTPGDENGFGPVKIGPLHDALKGDRWFQIVRNSDFKITQRWDMGKELAEAGYPDMSSAVRPMAIAPGRALRLLPGLLLPRAGRVRHPGQGHRRPGRLHRRHRPGAAHGRRTTRREPAQPGADDAQGAVRQRLRPPRAVHRQGRARRCAPPGTMDDYAALVDRKTMALQDLRHRDDRPLLRQALLDDRGPRTTPAGSR